MPEGTVRELIRAEYLPNAYSDQTGMAHWGHVVYEQVIVMDTEERFDVNDGYQVHKNHGFIAVTDDGRRFRLYTETVAYSGGLHIVAEDSALGLLGHWVACPLSLAGYCDPRGMPIAHLSALRPLSTGAITHPLIGHTIDENVADLLADKQSSLDAPPTF